MIEPLDRLPQPAWDLVDFRPYDKTLSISLRLGRRACVQTSRGCPYSCIYCQHYFGTRFRGRGPDHVMEEIEILHRGRGIPRIGILDDIFNADRKRAEAILTRLRDGYPNLKISFPNAVRGDLLDEPFIRLLKEARCDWMPIAVESGSARVQKMIRKNLDFEKILSASKALDKAGIASFVCFMVGFPTETPEEVEETFALARKFRGQVPVFSLVTPYPGTALWDMAHPEGASANPETIDGAYGYRFHDDAAGALLERTLKISRKGFLQPRYWYVIRDELRWRISSQWQILFMKLLSMVAPLSWKRRLIRRINRRLDLCLE
jgi:anaerobic magnesium-protoporphyrin IX monomethyl ester cyclase